MQVTDFRIKVFRRFSLGAATRVLCGYGGSGFAAYVDVDLDHPEAPAAEVLLDDFSDGLRVPPQSLRIEAGGFLTLQIAPTGTQGHFYEWQFEIDTVVDQRKKTFTIGSDSAPLRTSIDPDRDLDFIDFDPLEARWRPSSETQDLVFGWERQALNP